MPTRSAPPQRESFLVHAILKAWGAHPSLRIWRQNTGGAKINGYFVKFGTPGQGDISGILAGGRRLEIECKTERGRQSEEQVSFQLMIERFGGLYVLARSVEEVDTALAAVGVKR
jgi:hypothetical protein